MRLSVLFAIAVYCAAQVFSLVFYKKGFPVFEKPVLETHAVLDESFVLSGMRRFGGDMGFIQLLQYIETPTKQTEEYGLDKVLNPMESEENLLKKDRTFEYTLRCVSLDPYFYSSYLFGSALLAFSSLKQYDQALKILETGIMNDPTYWRFRLYAGAIGFQRAEKTGKVIELLEQALSYPDCPTMVKNILAYIYKKRGNLKRALEIYTDIVNTSRDQQYVNMAKNNMNEIKKELHIP